MSKVKLLLDVVEDLRSLADSVQAVADAMLQNEPTVDAEPKTPAPAPQKELTLEEVRAVLGEKSRAGFTTEIQALLKKYGAPKLSGIDPKHYEALLKDVEVLKDAPLIVTQSSRPLPPTAGSTAIHPQGWNWSSRTEKRKPQSKAPPLMRWRNTSSARR